VNSITRLLVKFSCLASLLGLASCGWQKSLPSGPAGTHPEQELAARIHSQSSLSVLFVGNSYSFGVPKAFSQLAAERGKSVRVGHATYGGWTLAKHAANQATLRKIRSGRWDIVVIQEQSEVPAFAARKRSAAMFPPLRQLVTEVRAQGAIPVLYQTWGRRDGDPRRPGEDFYAMNARLREGYRAAARNAGRLVVVPVGDAWEREFSAGRGHSLFVEDGSHPSGEGNRLTASLFYESFFGS
jgi:hypothetical protein